MMPRGRLTSSPWTRCSPTQVSFGPGGAVVRSCPDRKAASVCAGSGRRSRAMPRSAYRAKSNPAPANRVTNRNGVIPSSTSRWASTSCTVQPSHSDAVPHCSGVRPSRSSASARRSAWIVDQMSAAMSGPHCPHAVVALLVGQLGQAQLLEQRREVHAEPAAVALAQPVPATDRVLLGAAERLDRPGSGVLLLVGGAEVDPVAPVEQPAVQVLDRLASVLQRRRPDLADQDRRGAVVVAPPPVRRRAPRRRQPPRGPPCGPAPPGSFS